MVLKKLMSASGLLVASVALVNAATVIVNVDSTNFSASGNTATYTVSGLTFTIAASNSSSTLSFDTEKSSATGNEAWYTSSKSTLFTGDREWAKDLTTTWIQSGNKSDDLTVTISGYEANQTGITLSFVAGRPFEGAGTWAKNANVSNSYESGMQYTVANNAASATSTAITSTTSVDTTPFSAQYYSFSGITADSSGTVTFTIKGALAHSAGLSAIQCTIPEPSAFGLFAGLGAIALAVSRRRSRR